MQKIENKRFLNLNFLMRALQPSNPSYLKPGCNNPSGDRRDKQSQKKSRPHHARASLLRRRLVMKVLSSEIENGFKAKNILRRGLAKRLMRCQQRLRLLLFSLLGRLDRRGSLERSAVRVTRTITANIEYLIQAQPGEKLLAAVSTVNDVKMSVS